MRKNLAIGALAAGILGCAVTVSAAERGVSELIQALRSPDEATRVEAARKLAAASQDAAPAVPALVTCLKDPSAAVRAHAAEALGDIGAAARPAVEALVPMIGDPDAAVRREVIEALHSIRPGPQVVLPLLTKMLDDADPAVRLRALNALADRGAQAMPALVEALRDKEAAYWACLVISEIGPEAKDAVPGLTKLLADQRPDVRREAILALADIGEASAPAVPLLVEALDDALNRTPATYALGMIGKLPAEAEAKIEKNVNSSDPVLATVSAWVLARLHPDDAHRMRKAARLLIRRVMDKDPEVRKAAAEALLDLDPDPEILRPLWEKALAGADEEVVVPALDAMAALGAPLVPRLIAALEHEKTRPYAVYVLGQIGPEAEAAARPLAELLDDENPDVRREAAFALAKIGPEAKAAVPALVKALQNREGPACYGICYALGSIGPAAIAAEATLQKGLDSDDPSQSLFCAWALAHIHPDCQATCEKSVPVLIKGLGDAEANFRLHAAESLGCLGPRAKEAVPALKKALQDKDEQVRRAAADALKAIGN